MALLKNRGRPASKTEAVSRLASPEILARALLLTLLALAALPAAPAQAEVLVSNIGQSNTTVTQLRGSENAQGFETGDSTGGYTLESIEVQFEDVHDDLDISELSVELWGATTSGSVTLPDSRIAALTNPASIPASTDRQVAVFTAPANTTLSASTNYYVYLSYTKTSTEAHLSLTRSRSTGEDDTSAEGWSIHDVRRLRSRGTTNWGQSSRVAKIRVNGSAIGSSNNAPVFDPDTATRTIAENTAAGTAIGAAIPEATDADNDTLMYTMEGTDAASFTFTAATRQLSTKAALDHEAKSSYTVTIKADDDNGGTDTMAVTINVTDVDEPPSRACGAERVGDLGLDHERGRDLERTGEHRQAGHHELRPAIPRGRLRRLHRRPAGPDRHQCKHHRPDGGHHLPGAGARHQRRGRRALVRLRLRQHRHPGQHRPDGRQRDPEPDCDGGRRRSATPSRRTPSRTRTATP